MKNLFLISLLLLSVHAKGYFSLSVANPNSWGSPTRGIISEPMIEIKPMGVYAQVELTFKFSAQSSYHVKDSLEAVLNFDLPANSFINDSWLWLDENRRPAGDGAAGAEGARFKRAARHFTHRVGRAER